jgi:nucleoside-diphosphate-sugar epimerase
VLVIGGLGFIGVNLVARLVEHGALVTVVTRSRSAHAEHARSLEGQGVTVVEADIRDAAAIALAVTGQDVVFNLSGQSGAARSLEDPYTDLDINVRGNLVLLEALRAHNPQAMLVFVGSRLQYGRASALPVNEDALLEPLCLHAVHKSTVEQYLGVYRRLFGLRSVVARVTNPYGPGQPFGRTAYGVINRLIHLAIADQPLTIYGDGLQRRDYLYVEDLVSALLLLGSSDAAEAAEGHVYNVGSGAGVALVDVAAKVVDLAGGGTIRHVEWPALDAIIETGDFVADISRVRALGWQPAVSLDEGLERTIAFCRAQMV